MLHKDDVPRPTVIKMSLHRVSSEHDAFCHRRRTIAAMCHGIHDCSTVLHNTQTGMVSCLIEENI